MRVERVVLMMGGMTAVMEGMAESVIVGRVSTGSVPVGTTMGVVTVTGGSLTTTWVVVVMPPGTVVRPSETVVVPSGTTTVVEAEASEEAEGEAVTVVKGTVSVTTAVAVGSGKTGRVTVAVMPSVMTMEVNWAAARPAAERMAKERILAYWCCLERGSLRAVDERLNYREEKRLV